MMNQCNGQSECKFLIPKWYLGNPCPGEEIAKYLDIDYNCMKESK